MCTDAFLTRNQWNLKCGDDWCNKDETNGDTGKTGDLFFACHSFITGEKEKSAVSTAVAGHVQLLSQFSHVKMIVAGCGETRTETWPNVRMLFTVGLATWWFCLLHKHPEVSQTPAHNQDAHEHGNVVLICLKPAEFVLIWHCPLLIFSCSRANTRPKYTLGVY